MWPGIFVFMSLRGARVLLEWCGCDPSIFLPCAARDCAREARRNSLFLPPCGRGVSPPGEVWDACAACGKVGPVMGLRPLRGPPCIPPPKHPPRAFSISATLRGHASCAAGASLSRSARSGDLPPRRVNAIPCFRFGQSPFQPTLIAPLRPKDFTKWEAPITRGICHFTFRRSSSKAGQCNCHCL